MPAQLHTRPATTDDDEDRERMYGPGVPNREEIDALVRDAQAKTEREIESNARHEEDVDARNESYRALYRAAADHMSVKDMARAVGANESTFRTYIGDDARERRRAMKRAERARRRDQDTRE